jgi:hypothetical protein
MLPFVLRTLLAALVIAFVSETIGRFPRLAALVLSLPLVTIFSFSWSWYKDRNLEAIAQVSHDSLFLIPLTLPFFVVFAFAGRFGLSFWGAMLMGVVTTALCVGGYTFLFPK